MPGEVKRATRIGERLREELSNLLLHELRDPRVQGVIITKVAVTDDLRNARVYIRFLDGKDEKTRRENALTGFSRAGSMLRREVTDRLQLRYAPEFRFFYDEGQEARDRIDKLLDEVSRDSKKKKS